MLKPRLQHRCLRFSSHTCNLNRTWTVIRRLTWYVWGTENYNSNILFLRSGGWSTIFGWTYPLKGKCPNLAVTMKLCVNVPLYPPLTHTLQLRISLLLRFLAHGSFYFIHSWRSAFFSPLSGVSGDADRKHVQREMESKGAPISRNQSGDVAAIWFIS